MDAIFLRPLLCARIFCKCYSGVNHFTDDAMNNRLCNLVGKCKPVSFEDALADCAHHPRGREKDPIKGWQGGEMDFDTSVLLVFGPVVRLSASSDVSLDGFPPDGRACRGQRRG